MSIDGNALPDKFGAARSYRLVIDGKTYDSKAIVGAAHGVADMGVAAANISAGCVILTVGPAVAAVLWWAVTRSLILL